MYDKYLKYHNIPFGTILDRIRTKEHLSQRELALRSGIPYQRINDFIANRRRISPENSLRLEKVLISSAFSIRHKRIMIFIWQPDNIWSCHLQTSQSLEKHCFGTPISMLLTGNATTNGLSKGFSIMATARK